MLLMLKFAYHILLFGFCFCLRGIDRQIDFTCSSQSYSFNIFFFDASLNKIFRLFFHIALKRDSVVHCFLFSFILYSKFSILEDLFSSGLSTRIRHIKKQSWWSDNKHFSIISVSFQQCGFAFIVSFIAVWGVVLFCAFYLYGCNMTRSGLPHFITSRHLSLFRKSLIHLCLIRVHQITVAIHVRYERGAQCSRGTFL